MRKIVTIGFAAGLLAAAFPAQAADTNTNANHNEAAAREQPQAARSNSRDRLICVTEARSETRIPRQVCHTAREWRDIQAENEDD
jgi:hypothetical protein